VNSAGVLEQLQQHFTEEWSKRIMMNHVTADFIPEEDLMAVRLSLLRNWLKQGVSKDDAEDLVQEGILKGLRNLEKFRGESGLKTWLIAVAKNEGYTYLRKQARQGRIKQRLFEVIEAVSKRRQSGRRKPRIPTE
jgi:RNA polymerase sigma factor (sigma-70 family)